MRSGVPHHLWCFPESHDPRIYFRKGFRNRHFAFVPVTSSHLDGSDQVDVFDDCENIMQRLRNNGVAIQVNGFVVGGVLEVLHLIQAGEFGLVNNDTLVKQALSWPDIGKEGDVYIRHTCFQACRADYRFLPVGASGDIDNSF